ncbi:MAG: uroporphyrinogen-III synthase [Methanocorpusculum sp.]|nr:uroporphyrinogen-III synthase [Methanocorpusculum sp.]
MLIAITRLAEKGDGDAAVCKEYGHTARIVSPLRAELNASQVQNFVLEANNKGFDAIFFTSAYPAEKIGTLLDPKIYRYCRVVAIGPKTASVLLACGIAAETLPSYYSRDFVPYLGDWIEGKRIGIPRAAVPNPGLLSAIENAGGMAFEYRCYALTPTNEILNLEGADAVLFTSANSFKQAKLPDLSGMTVLAIGDITAAAMEAAGVRPAVVGDGSLTGTLAALNAYLGKQ